MRRFESAATPALLLLLAGVLLVFAAHAGPVDSDGDDVLDDLDNCPFAFNPSQTNADIVTDPPGDSYGNSCDNCTLIANQLQIDSDHDGFGNQCDPDINNDGIVGLPDIGAFIALFGQTVPPAPPYFDFTGGPYAGSFGSPPDGIIGLPDLGKLLEFFGSPPGPAAVSCTLDLRIHKPKVIDPDEEAIPDNVELSQGAQTFVNLDNDDRDGTFDLGTADTDVPGEDETVRLELYVAPLPGAATGTATLRVTSGSSSIRLWDSADKKTELTLSPGPIVATGFTWPTDFTFISPLGVWLKTVWVEGVETHTTQRETRLELGFDQCPGLKDPVALTVLGVKKLDWLGKGNGFTAGGSPPPHDSDTLDQDPNFGAGSNRVFPGARAAATGVALDKVDLEVELTLAPVEDLDVFVKAFDADDPYTDTEIHANVNALLNIPATVKATSPDATGNLTALAGTTLTVNVTGGALAYPGHVGGTLTVSGVGMTVSTLDPGTNTVTATALGNIPFTLSAPGGGPPADATGNITALSGNVFTVNVTGGAIDPGHVGGTFTIGGVGMAVTAVNAGANTITVTAVGNIPVTVAAPADATGNVTALGGNSFTLNITGGTLAGGHASGTLTVEGVVMATNSVKLSTHTVGVAALGNIPVTITAPGGPPPANATGNLTGIAGTTLIVEVTGGRVEVGHVGGMVSVGTVNMTSASFQAFVDPNDLGGEASGELTALAGNVITLNVSDGALAAGQVDGAVEVAGAEMVVSAVNPGASTVTASALANIPFTVSAPANGTPANAIGNVTGLAGTTFTLDVTGGALDSGHVGGKITVGGAAMTITAVNTGASTVSVDAVGDIPVSVSVPHSGTTGALVRYTTEDDNRGLVHGHRSGEFAGHDGDLIRKLTFTPADTTQKAEFQVSLHPGDSYRVVANGDSGFLRELRNRDLLDGFRIVDPYVAGSAADREVREADKYTSNVLGVWRLLHVENDSMVAVPAAGMAQTNTVTGNLTSMVNAPPAQAVFLSVNLVTGLPNPPDDSPNLSGGGATLGAGRFENGTFTVGTDVTNNIGGNYTSGVGLVGTFNIPFTVAKVPLANATGNVLALAGNVFTLNVTGGALDAGHVGGTLTVGGVGMAIAAVNPGASTVTVTALGNIPFTLVDDDSFVLPDDSSLAQLSSFEAASVLHVADGGGGANSKQDVPFVLNGPNTSAGEVAIYNAKRESAGNETDQFWVVYVCSAYQDTQADFDAGSMTWTGDNDPESEGTYTGSTSPFGSVDDVNLSVGGDGALIWREAEADTAQPHARNVAHEVGHQFGLGHGNNAPVPEFPNVGLMHPTLTSPVTPDALSPRHLNLVRSRVKSPGE